MNPTDAGNLKTPTLMERHFVIPVVIAAVLHGLLFGVPRGTVPPVGGDDVIAPPRTPPPFPPPTIEVVDRHSDDIKTPTGSPNPALRTIDEPQIETKNGFVVPVQPQPVTTYMPDKTMRIDFGPASSTGPGEGGIDLGNIVTRAALDHQPRARVQVAPAYPFEARHEGRTGEVAVAFVVDEAGRVLDPQVASSTDPVFNEAALKAVSKWRFEPGTVHGRVVRFRMAVPMRFSLTQ